VKDTCSVDDPVYKRAFAEAVRRHLPQPEECALDELGRQLAEECRRGTPAFEAHHVAIATATKTRDLPFVKQMPRPSRIPRIQLCPTWDEVERAHEPSDRDRIARLEAQVAELTRRLAASDVTLVEVA